MSAHVSDRLSAYLDQELSVLEAAAVRDHVAGCEPCATRLAHLAAVDGRLRELPALAPAGYFDSFASRVRTRIETAQRPRAPFRVPAWSWAVAAAVLVAVVVPRMHIDQQAPEASPAKAPAAANVPGPAQPVATPPATVLPQMAQNNAPASASTAEAERLHGLGYLEPSAEGRTRAKAAPSMAATPSAPSPPKRESGSPFASAPPPSVPMPRPTPAPAVPAESGKAAGLASDKLDAAGAPAPLAAAESYDRDEARRQVAEGSARDLEKDNRQGEDLKLAEQPAAAAAAPGRADEQKKSRRAGVAGTMAQAAPSLAETEYRALESRGTRASLAVQRDAWRAFAARHPEDPRADEARVRVVALGVELARQTGAEDDRALAREDGANYLARKDAAQKARVRALLDGMAP